MLCPLYLLHLLELYTDDNLLLTRLLKTYANQPQNNGNLGTCVFTSVGHRGVICHTIITFISFLLHVFFSIAGTISSVEILSAVDLCLF